jgi:hypothetical protein
MAPAPVRDVEIVSALVASDASCLACLARRSGLPADRVLAALRCIEQEWREPLMDTARCAACRAMTTIYSLRLP